MHRIQNKPGRERERDRQRNRETERKTLRERRINLKGYKLFDLKTTINQESLVLA